MLKLLHRAMLLNYQAIGNLLLYIKIYFLKKPILISSLDFVYVITKRIFYNYDAPSATDRQKSSIIIRPRIHADRV